MNVFYFIIKIGDRMKSFCLGNVLSEFNEITGSILSFCVSDIYTQRKDDKIIPYFLNDAQYQRLCLFVVPCIKAVGFEKIEIIVTDSKYNIIYSSESEVICSRRRIDMSKHNTK